MFQNFIKDPSFDLIELKTSFIYKRIEFYEF